MHAHLPTETAKGKIKMLVFTPILASAILKASMRDRERERLEREYWSKHHRQPKLRLRAAHKLDCFFHAMHNNDIGNI